MPPTNHEINLILTWSANCIIAARTAANQVTAFATTDTKLYVPVVIYQLMIMQSYCNS